MSSGGMVCAIVASSDAAMPCAVWDTGASRVSKRKEKSVVVLALFACSLSTIEGIVLSTFLNTIVNCVPLPATFYTAVLAGQVMTRMSRDMFGGPGARPSVSNTCKIVTSIFVVVLVIQCALQIVMDTEACYGGRVRINQDTLESEIECPDGSIEELSDTYNAVRAISGVIGCVFAIYILVAVCRTRYAMRKKYSIPPRCCGGCEDCCCSFWCSCCTVRSLFVIHCSCVSTSSVSCFAFQARNEREYSYTVYTHTFT